MRIIAIILFIIILSTSCYGVSISFRASDFPVCCDQCDQEMEDVGMWGGIYASNPPQWDEMYICHTCKQKKLITMTGKTPDDYSHYSYINDYEWAE